MFAQLYIAPILHEFLALHPGMSLDLRLNDMEFDLIQGSFDSALRNSALADSSLKGRKLADDMRILCASPEYLNQHGMPIYPDELAAHQLIAFKEQSPLQLVGRDGKEAQFNPRLAGCRFIVDDGLSQKIATIAGAGVSMNALWSVHRELDDGSLVRVLPDYRVDDLTALWIDLSEIECTYREGQDIHRFFVGEDWQSSGLDQELIVVARLAFDTETQTSS